ncbi:PH domain-containing protein [Myroides sp. BIT-d1]|uniref:PH domain-containing protein n=1 Tax=Myroides albus TaxID=2562892 RepID=A0A6I3LNH7_9FLAO|nr:PH domain-containing protein [Myroides albus]MVX34902.1 PH domain-containing protein [Myroides sp. LoEW2-1]
MDFYQVHRQDPIGIIVNFLNGFQKLARAFLPILLILFVRISRSDYSISMSLVYGVILAIVVLSVFAYLNYRYFTFYIDRETDSFVISKGIINKSKTMIQLSKIQQVNINQSFLNKILEVYAIEIDSAGSSAKEGVIPAVSLEVGQQLKETLLAYKQSVEIQGETDIEKQIQQEEEQLKQISFSTLFKVGATSNYLYTIGAFIVFMNTLFYEGSRIYKGIYQEDPLNYIEGKEIVLIEIIGYFAVFLLAVLLVNLIRTIIRYYNYQIVLKNGSLFLSYGLLHTKSTIIKPSRVQIVKATRNYFQKLWQITNFKVYQVAGSDAKNKKTALEIPGCSNEEMKDLFYMFYNKEFTTEGATLKHNYRYFGFRFFFLVVLPLCVGYLLMHREFDIKWVVSSMVVYFVFSTFLIWRYYRNGALIVSDDFICIRSGAWDITHTIVQVHKIQKIVVSQLWWQADYNVGSLTIYTAGGKIGFSTSKYRELCRLRDQWLCEVEYQNKAWM